MKPPSERQSYLSPKFLIIGAQKAGTVSLYSHFFAHPNIAPSEKKEIGYFDQDINYSKGDDWYSCQFPVHDGTERARVTFEATPDYLFYPKAPERIVRFDPNMKLVILLREPAARAYSAWNMFRTLVQTRPEFLRSVIPECDPLAQESLTNMLQSDSFPEFEKVIEQEISGIQRGGGAIFEPGYLQRGLYEDQLRRYLKYFDRRQMFIAESDRLAAEPSAVLTQITKFLDLPEYDWSSHKFQKFHVGTYETEMNTRTAARLRDFYRPYNLRLYDLLGCEFAW
jgi:hypothetical protein